MTRGQTPRAGRLPDHNGPVTILPREGRQAPAPAWPLPGTPSPREAQLWERAWRRPQAILWERDGLEDLVGLYVRKTAEAEIPASPSATVETARRLADDLLLTVPAMKRAGVAIAQPQADPGSSRPGGSSVIPLHGGPGSRSRQTLGHRTAKERFTRTTPTTDTEETPTA